MLALKNRRRDGKRSEVKKGKSFSFLIILIALFLLVPLVLALASGSSSDLSDFITDVAIYDMSTNPPTIVSDDTPTFVGQTYRFKIDFAETSQLQMEYNASGVLTYKLPDYLTIQNAVLQTPLYGSSPNYAIIGWHTIDVYGNVEMWFNNVDLNGNPTPGNVNFIDYYATVEITLDVYAQLMGSDDGDIDFGGGVIVGIVPPTDPPPSLSMHKTSRYEPSSERIYYMISITALGGSVTDIALTDSPTITAGHGTVSFLDDPSAFSRFRYDLNGDTAFETLMDVEWSDSPLEFSYEFAGLTLGQDEFITIRYFLDIQTLVENNYGPGQALEGMSTTLYNFTVNNSVTVDGNDASEGEPLPSVSDNTTDHVKKELVISKNGTFFSGDNRIQWSVVIGDGVSIQLNDGIITDRLQSNLTLPTDDQILIKLYGSAGSQIFSGAVDDVIFTGLYTRDADDGGFTLTLPDDSYEAIYKVVITYSTTVDAPQQGMPPTIYGNDITFTLPGGAGGFGADGSVPVKADPVTVTKATSGICGNPDAQTGPAGERYWVDYKATVDVPAGLQGQPLYLYDVLTISSSSKAPPNSPVDLNVEAEGIEVATTLLAHTDPVVSGNTWRVYFGESADDTPALTQWQYDEEVTLTITYRIYLDDSTVAELSDKSTARELQNTIHLINSTDNPALGATGNSVGSKSVTDDWPIFKRVSKTDNPALFNYTVTINGAYSSREAPFLQEGKSPVFLDTFDTRLDYVPGSFYVVDTSTPGRYFAPADDVQVTGSSFSVDLSSTNWQVFSGTQAPGSLIGDAPENWFANKHTYQVHYQLHVRSQYLETAQSGMENSARITVNPGECAFESDITVAYNPELLSKTMTPVSTGSDRINVEIVINADGQFVFSDGVSPAPDLITAQDRLVNLMLFTDTVQFYTQSLDNGIWDGVWIDAPAASFNTHEAWSVNVVSLADVPAGFDAEVDFVIPNETPVMLRYQAHATLTPGTPGEIKNEVWIFGEYDGDGDKSYVVEDDGVGVGADRQLLRVFKQDNAGNNLAGAGFSLYATDLSAGYVPPGGLPAAKTITAEDGTVLEFGLLPDEMTHLTELLTDINGTTTFDNQWINSSYRFLYLLVENTPPEGYIAVHENNYFTISPKIDASEIANLGALVNADVNQISDFTTVTNTPLSDAAGTLRVRKVFKGLSDAEIQRYLQGFEIVITDPSLEEHTFKLIDALSPYGIVLTDIQEGLYTIDERNAEVPGFTLNTSPAMPIKSELMPNYEGEILFTIENSYTQIPPEPPAQPPAQPPKQPGRGPLTGEDLQILSTVALMLLAIIVAGTAVTGLRREAQKGK